MRVLVDGMAARIGGGYTFLVEEMRALGRVRPDLEVTVLTSPWNDSDLRNDQPFPTRRAPVRGPGARFAFQQAALPLLARRHDVLYCTGNFAPLVPSSTPTVLCIQDCRYFVNDHMHDGGASLKGWSRQRACHASVRRADLVFAVSKSMGDMIGRALPDAADKITVNESGAPVWSDAAEAVAGIAEPFVLSVANASPHKHLDDVVRGWAAAVAETGCCVRLVLTGRMSNDDVARHCRVAGEACSLLVHPGPIADRRQVRWLYEHALAMVTMSTLESFGLTAIEAISLGCPVVATDIPAHREVAADHAEYVQPHDTRALAMAISQLVSGPDRTRSGGIWPFTWDDHGKTLLSEFDRLQNDPGQGQPDAS